MKILWNSPTKIAPYKISVYVGWKFYTICSDVGSKEQWKTHGVKILMENWYPQRQCYVVGLITSADVQSVCVNTTKCFQLVFSPKKRFVELKSFWCFLLKIAITFLPLGWYKWGWNQLDETKSHGTKVRDQHKYVKKIQQNMEVPRCYRGVKFSSIFDQLHSPLAWVRPVLKPSCQNKAARSNVVAGKYIFDIWDETIFYWKGFSSFWKSI